MNRTIPRYILEGTDGTGPFTLTVSVPEPDWASFKLVRNPRFPLLVHMRRAPFVGLLNAGLDLAAAMPVEREA